VHPKSINFIDYDYKNNIKRYLNNIFMDEKINIILNELLK
jgi:hypothetical protein